MLDIEKCMYLEVTTEDYCRHMGCNYHYCKKCIMDNEDNYEKLVIRNEKNYYDYSCEKTKEVLFENGKISEIDDCGGFHCSECLQFIKKYIKLDFKSVFNNLNK